MRVHALLVLVPLAIACSKSSDPSAPGLGTACTAYLGSCVPDGSPCETRAPDFAQDCNTNPPIPSGPFCCFAAGEGGAGSGGSGFGPGGADAFVAAQVGPGPLSPSCPLGTAGQRFLDVGGQTGATPETVLNGSASAGGTIQVHCSVKPAAGGFDVDLSLTVPGSAGGSLAITSPAGQGAVTLSGGVRIAGVFQGAAGSYRETDCTLGFTYQGNPVPEVPAVSSGRIW